MTFYYFGLRLDDLRDQAFSPAFLVVVLGTLGMTRHFGDLEVYRPGKSLMSNLAKARRQQPSEKNELGQA
jgi:hypothetical protein